jgi:hypothetical protein
MDKEQPDYLSYLLRLWRVSGEEKAVWRASLESPHTGERRGFANLADLFTFLEKETGHATRGQTAPNADEKGGVPISDNSIGRQESKT